MIFTALYVVRNYKPNNKNLKVMSKNRSKNQTEKLNVSGSKSTGTKPNTQRWEQPRTDRNKR